MAASACGNLLPRRLSDSDVCPAAVTRDLNLCLHVHGQHALCVVDTDDLSVMQPH